MSTITAKPTFMFVLLATKGVNKGRVSMKASASHHQQPVRPGSSASAPYRRSQSTGPASRPTPASSSPVSASTHPGSAPQDTARIALSESFSARPRGRRRRLRFWERAHVWEPSVNQLMLSGEQLTAASDQAAPGAHKQGSALHGPSAGRVLWISTGKQRRINVLLLPSGCVCVCVCKV